MTLRRVRINLSYSTRGTTQIAEKHPPLFRVLQPVDTNAVARDGSTCLHPARDEGALPSGSGATNTATVSVTFTYRHLSENRIGASSPSRPFDTDNYITSLTLCQFFCLGKTTQNFLSRQAKFCHISHRSLFWDEIANHMGQVRPYGATKSHSSPSYHSLLRWILPLMVLGSSSRNTTIRGYL